ncbi:hypothetical protein CR164_01280 [Prosthecochloris marina]|uniref:Uncharacterized protein n=1 Tax=Prosthecochloris marina TaxID=2017681 RepID=A0A317T951_9CHLB|nr:hypothetical protein [Prosthecochloris marina]PWW83222.1 hypothetical protein CR164_01280 [Prosthecochloris marina]
MNIAGKKNIVVGTAYFVLTLGLGMFLVNMLMGQDPLWMDSPVREMLAAAHSHGGLEALINVLFGYLIYRFGARMPLVSKIASWLLLGGLLHSGSAYLAGIGLTAAEAVAPFGAVSLITGVVLMLPVLVKGVDSENSGSA